MKRQRRLFNSFGIANSRNKVKNYRSNSNTNCIIKESKYSKTNTNLKDISMEYNLIQEKLNTPGSILQKSKLQSREYKKIEYRKLYKHWRNHNEHKNMEKNLSLFHNHLNKLRKNVYPFTLIDKVDFNKRERIKFASNSGNMGFKTRSRTTSILVPMRKMSLI